MIPLSSARRRPPGSYRAAAAPRPPVPPRAGPAPRRRPRRARRTARRRPRAAPSQAAGASLRGGRGGLGGGGGGDAGPPRRATLGASPPGGRPSSARRPRVTKELRASRGSALNLRAAARPPMRRAPVAKAPAAAPAAAPWLRPGRRRAEAPQGGPGRPRQAQAERAAHGLNALAKLEKREAAADDAAAKAALSMRVRCFRCVDCARLFESKPEACVRRDHHIEMAFGMRRCFACGRCGKSTYSLERRPRGACACGADAWRNRENENDVRAVAAPDTFRPALAEWTSPSDVSVLVNNI